MLVNFECLLVTRGR